MLFVRVTIFARLTAKQNVTKKAKDLTFDRLEIVLNYFYWLPDDSSEKYMCFDITNYAFSFENEYV